MRAVLQRVKSASVTVDGNLVSSIGTGLLVLVGVAKDDTVKEAESMATRILRAKLWDAEAKGDEEPKKWKRNVQEISGEILCVSQFTLLATTKKAAPDMKLSATATEARRLYEAFFTKTRALYVEDKVKDGVFQAKMDVALVNDGPVGVEYECIDGAVTIQIDLDPPQMDLDGSTEVNEDSVEDFIGNVTKRFTLPPELLE